MGFFIIKHTFYDYLKIYRTELIINNLKLYQKYVFFLSFLQIQSACQSGAF